MLHLAYVKLGMARVTLGLDKQVAAEQAVVSAVRIDSSCEVAPSVSLDYVYVL